MRISHGVPNLIGGVSQQTPELRLVNQSEDITNMTIDASRGVSTRPGTLFKDLLTIGGDLNKAKFHFIRRDEDEKYALIVNEYGALFAYDLLNNQFVNVEDNTPNTTAAAYITSGSSAPIDSLVMNTFGDSTFLVNKNVTVEMDPSSETGAPLNEGLVQITRGLWNLTYAIYITFEDDTTRSGSFFTGKPGDVLDGTNFSTNTIAENLATDLASKPNMYTTVLGDGDTIYITSDYSSPIKEIRVRDSNGGNSSKVAFRAIRGIDELPALGVPGATFKIIEDDGSYEFIYYVEWVSSTDDDESYSINGYWKETTAWNMVTEIDQETMPLQIKRLPDLPITFSIELGEWEPRKVGDEDSCPTPSFIDKTISDIFFHKSRIGFLAGENVIMSRTSELKSFFNESARALYDTDPIDIAASTRDVNNLKSAIPLQGGLIVVGENKQFVLGSSGALSPKTVSMDVTTSYVTEAVTPITIGSYGYLAVQKGSFTSIREYQVDNLTSTSMAPDISKHVDSYIRGTAVAMAASSAYNTMFIITKEDGERTNSIYLYQWFEVDNRRVQSSWCKWELDDSINILGLAAFDKDVWIICSRPNESEGNCTLIQMDLSVTPLGSMPYNAVMDFISDVDNIVYDHITDTTSFSTPDNKNTGEEPFVLFKEDFGELVAGDNLSNIEWDSGYTTGSVNGDLTGSSLIYGYPIRAELVFSTQYVREDEASSGSVVDGRLQLIEGRVVYKDSGEFTIEVDNSEKGGDIYKYTTGGILGDSEFKIGDPYINSGVLKFAIFSKNTDVTIRAKVDKFFPVSLQKLEWTGNFTMISQRR